MVRKQTYLRRDQDRALKKLSKTEDRAEADLIRQAVDEPGVKAVAAALKVSPALVYKWCEPPAEKATRPVWWQAEWVEGDLLVRGRRG